MSSSNTLHFDEQVRKETSELNYFLWDQVHKLEFLIEETLRKRKKDKKNFSKKLLRLSKYLDINGVSPQQIKGVLQSVDSDLKKVAVTADLIESDHSSDESLNKIRRKIKTKKMKGEEVKHGEETENDSEFEGIEASKMLNERRYGDDFLAMAELAGRIPSSYLVDINYEKFQKETGFEPLDINGQQNQDHRPVSNQMLPVSSNQFKGPVMINGVPEKKKRGRKSKEEKAAIMAAQQAEQQANMQRAAMMAQKQQNQKPFTPFNQ